jgi:tRNA(Ile)-lysidine synthase TilS/MesJ
VLPETFPGIRFDEHGVCNYCHAEDRTGDLTQQKARYRQKFEKLWEQRNRGASAYDCLVSFSGGKDSSYTVALMARDYGAKVLALTVDNGFVSPRAFENARRVVEALGVDHMLFKPRFDVLKKIFRACSSKTLFATKAIERASTICNACMGIVKFVSLRTAIEKSIPFVAFGWSPGQAGLSSSVFKAVPRMMRSMQKSVREPLQGIAGADIEPYFLDEQHFARTNDFPYYINPLAFHEYDEQQILSYISELGWSPPDDTDPNSTNCLLNCYGNAVHREQFGFHPYAFELAGLVRQGALDRQEAIARLSEPEDEAMVEMVKRRLGGDAAD